MFQPLNVRHDHVSRGGIIIIPDITGLLVAADSEHGAVQAGTIL